MIYDPPTEPYLTVLHQDDDILVISKQSGILSVPGRPKEHSDSIEKRAQEQFPEARIVHRLDMDTSGIMIMAMNANAHRILGLQFEKRKTKKTYIARVLGKLEKQSGEVKEPLICDWPNRPLQKICYEHGKPAHTDWHVLGYEKTNKADEDCTRVELTPHTGRSHQLRVHMLHLGHPILGDDFYGRDKAMSCSDRLELHAQSLTIHHPNGGALPTFEDKCPF